jgi:hypothetical protein
LEVGKKEGEREKREWNLPRQPTNPPSSNFLFVIESGIKSATP